MTSQYELFPVVDTSSSELRSVTVLKGRGEPGPQFAGNDLEFFLLENRVPRSFDQRLNFGNPAFKGGLLIWHYSGFDTFPNSHHLRVIEADADSTHPWGRLSLPADSTSNFLGSTAVYFPGDSNVVAISDTSLPGFKLQNEDNSNLALQGISFNASDSTVLIDSIFVTRGMTFVQNHTVWSGEIDLNSTVIVTSSGHLELAPGTVVTADTADIIDKAGIIVESGGEFTANGLVNDPILIESNGNSQNSWNGIEFQDSVTISLSNLTIRDATLALDFEYIEGQVFNNLTIDNCATGIIFNGNRNTFDQCTFQNTNVNIQMPADSTTTIKNSSFSGGSLRDVVPSGSLFPAISNCDFDTNADVVLYSSAAVTGNRFHNATLELRGDASVVNNVFIDSLANDNGITITKDRVASISPVIRNNSISSYRFGIYVQEDWDNSGDFIAEPDIRNNILYQNTLTQNDSATLGGNGTVAFNNIFNVDTTGAGIGTNGNISSDPKFVDVATQDFHLKSTSPSIDTGDSLSSYANEPSPNGGRINMGAYGNTAEATLTFDQIVEANLTADTTWSGYVNILNDISTNGNALTVLKNTRVLFDDGVTLTIDSDLKAGPITGVPSGSDSTVFSGYREKDTMGGLLVMAGSVDTLFMRYTHFNKANSAVTIQGELGGTTAMDSSLLEFLTFEDNTTGLYLSRVEVRVDSSTFRNNKDGIIASQSDLDLFGSLLEDNNRRGLYLNHSEMKIKGNTFDDNGINGVMFKYSSTGS